MLNTLVTSLKIDYLSAVNSFLYYFRKSKMIDKLFSSFYERKEFKIFLSLLASICTLFYQTFSKTIYFVILIFISKYLSKSDIYGVFIYLYFIFCMIGMFINTNLLNIGYKHYISIILLKMDAKKYLLSHLLFRLFFSFILDIIFLYFILINTDYNFLYIFLLPTISLLTKIVGEVINLKYYIKRKVLIAENYLLYFSIIILFLLVAFLPYFGIIFPNSYYFIIFSFLIPFFVHSLWFLFAYKDYKKIVKEILTSRTFRDDSSFNRKELVQISEKDIKADSKLKRKKGLDLLNAIFFERHKKILINSSIGISVFLVIIFIVGLIYLNNHAMGGNITTIVESRLSSLIVIMYFINRGAIITQAMFTNCDIAMLRYNFYRNSDIIIEMFWRRLRTIIKINLIPASTIGLLITILMILFGNYSFIYIILIFLFPLLLSLLFSIHYLTIYYLFQPYNTEIKMVNFGYSIINFFLSIFCFAFISISIPLSILFVGTLIVTIIYGLLSNYLIKNRACSTFRIK